jgi:hypothetical protein
VTETLRRTSRFRPIYFVLPLLLAFAGGVAGAAAPASATPGLIDGYVYELDGTTPIVGATVLWDDGSNPPAYVTTTTDASGYYFFTPAPGWDNESFEIVAFGGGNRLDDSASGYYETSDPASGEMPPFLLGPARRITGIARDAATGLPLEDVLVIAISETTSDPYLAVPPTGASGAFDVGVPPGDDYVVFAVEGSGDYDIQAWDHVNQSSCACIDPTPVTVPAGTGAPVTGISFDLFAFDDWIYFSVLAEDLNGDPLHPLLVHLDRRTGPTTWTLDVDTASTDTFGYADLLGEGDGDYRLRYSVGGVYKAIDSWYEPTYFSTYPLYDAGKSVELDGLTTACGCGGFTTLEVDIVFPVASSGGGGGGSTPGTPRRPSSGSNASFTVATPTPTPTPSATPTSSPSPSTSPSESPSPSATPDPTTPTSDAGFPWWIILIVILVLGIVITIIVMVRRR